MNTFKILLIFIVIAFQSKFSYAVGQSSPNNLDLSGQWSCTLDEKNVGISEEWFLKRLDGVSIKLPGGLNENKVGKREDEVFQNIAQGKFAPEVLSGDGEYRIMSGLTRQFTYIGKAWYQKEIEVSNSFTDRHITLFMERCGWETSVWIDGKPAGTENSLVTPHIYDLSELLLPGKHTITILCDNEQKLNYGGMMIAEDGYTNWNGIIGKMEITAKDKIWIEDVKVFPNVAYTQADAGNRSGNSIKCKIKIGNKTGKPFSGTIILNAQQSENNFKNEESFEVKGSGDLFTEVEFELKTGDSKTLWNEFSPNLYDLTVNFTAKADANKYADSKTETFGMRDLFRDGTQFTINHKPVFLRGILDNGVSPLLARPDTDIESWIRRFTILKSYGFNYFRCHSNVPPEAAFDAADKVGIYLQVELSRWSCPISDENPNVTDFAERELKRILETFGNHPSFCFMSMGNELLIYRDEIFLKKQQEMLMKGVNYGQVTDKRHQYTCTTHPITPGRNDDFYVSATYAGISPLGIRWGGHNPLDKSLFCLQAPSTSYDYREIVHLINRPVITHEVGQWQVFPNLAEIPKYTGVLKPRNFELIKEKLKQKNLLDQAADFTKSSGRLAFILYKEEVEAALRTPGLAGFQLLNLYDYPGQGTSTVGVLDVFWDSKGITTPEEYSSFNGNVVPLLRMEKRVWKSDEIFDATSELTFFMDKPMFSVVPEYTITDKNGKILMNEELPFIPYIPVGEKVKYPVSLGKIRFSLYNLPAPAKYTIQVSVKGTKIANNWEFWLYPAQLQLPANNDVIISRELNAETKNALNEGKTVLLLSGNKVLKNAVPGIFTTLFWNMQMKNLQVGTMGLLINTEHPLFKHFPTEYHTNWQWWDLVMHSQSVILDKTKAEFKPIVQVVDNPYRNQKLGAIFETRIGKGRLLFCGFDINASLETRPEAKQLKYSILEYMRSAEFQPQNELSMKELEEILQ